MNDLQRTLLNIMLTIDKLCKDNGITYYLTGGSALGAVRHKGFIPWDDDMDIFITTEEYRRLKDAFVTSSLDGYVLQEFFVNSEYWIYSKIRITGTTQIEREEDKSSMKMQGIFIDVFPIRKCSTERHRQYLQYIMSQYMVMRGQIEQNWKPKNKKQDIMIRLSRYLPNSLLFRIASRYIANAECRKADYCYCFFEIGRGIKMKKLVFPVKMFSTPRYSQFEDCFLPLPTDCEGFLAQYYGDYMMLPPVEQRAQFHHGIEVSVDEDYSIHISNARGTKVKDMKWLEIYPSKGSKQ